MKTTRERITKALEDAVQDILISEQTKRQIDEPISDVILEVRIDNQLEILVDYIEYYLDYQEAQNAERRTK